MDKDATSKTHTDEQITLTVGELRSKLTSQEKNEAYEGPIVQDAGSMYYEIQYKASVADNRKILKSTPGYEDLNELSFKQYQKELSADTLGRMISDLMAKSLLRFKEIEAMKMTQFEKELNPPAPPAPETPPAEPACTVNDILIFVRETEQIKQWKTANPMKPSHTRMSEYVHYLQEVAYNCCYSGRITSKDQAYRIPLYMRFTKEATKEYRAELSENILLSIVYEIATKHDIDTPTALVMTVEAFGRLWDSPPKRKEPNKIPVDQKVKTGGLPKLGKRKKTTPAEAALQSAYELIRPIRKPEVGPSGIVEHFQHNRQFKELVAEAGRKFDKKFARAAIDWIDRNPINQETQSEN